MMRAFMCRSIFSLIVLVLVNTGPIQAADPDYQITGPINHENLSIYFIHGKSMNGSVPLTLQEAMDGKKVKVHETGNVHSLKIENLSDEQIFIQSGDIVKGGKQDRVLSVSLLLPPRSGQVPIASFCVERGRWSKRGAEDVKNFTTSSTRLPSKEAKIAMKAPRKALKVTTSRPSNIRPAEVRPRPAARNRIPQGQRIISTEDRTQGTRQQEIWKNVAKSQEKLSTGLNMVAAADISPSSLQLTLEKKELLQAQKTYSEKLKREADRADNIIGYAFAINGKLNSADVFPSNGLFKKLWPKLLEASVTEALGEKVRSDKTQSAKNAKPTQAPSASEVGSFLKSAHKGKTEHKSLIKDVSLETNETPKAFYFETKVKKKKAWVHRNYLVR